MSAQDEVRIVLCTCPDETVAGELADRLVGDGLAACVNALPGITSTYLWNGEVCRDAEVLLVIKTVARAQPALEQCITALHPYELPEILAVPVQGGLRDYLDWVRRSVSARSSAPGPGPDRTAR